MSALINVGKKKKTKAALFWDCFLFPLKYSCHLWRDTLITESLSGAFIKLAKVKICLLCLMDKDEHRMLASVVSAKLLKIIITQLLKFV